MPLERELEPAYDDPVVQVVAQVHIVQTDHPLLVCRHGAGGVALHVFLLSLVNNENQGFLLVNSQGLLLDNPPCPALYTPGLAPRRSCNSQCQQQT